MAAPTLVGSAYEMSFSNVSSVNLTLLDGLQTGNALVIGVTQAQGIKRAITSISDGTNSYAELVTETLSSAHTHIHGKAGVTGVAINTTLTLTFDGNSNGHFFAQEISPATLSGLTDSNIVSSAGLNHLCGATGLTTSGDVFLFGVGCINGTGTRTAGTNWTRLDSSTFFSIMQYRRSDTGLTADQGPFTSSISRASSGCMVAFYAAGGGGNRRRRFFAVAG